MQVLKRLARHVALGSAPLLALMLFVPTSSGNAQFSVFTALLNTVGGMSGSLVGMQQMDQSTMMFEQTMLWPTTIMSQFRGDFSQLDSLNQGPLTAMFSMPMQNATLPLSMALESQIFSGSPSLVGTSYINMYGPNLLPPQAPMFVVPSIGMTDATAMDSLQLAMSADSTIVPLVGVAEQIRSEAASRSAGVQDILTAQSMANELECLAQQHRLYASLLREEAARLALTGMKYKQTATAIQNTNQGVQNVVGTGGQTP